MSVPDTNILVHATSIDSPDYARARGALGRLASDGPIAITRQILREYLSAVTRPQTWRKATPMQEAIAAVNELSEGFDILEDGPQVWLELTALAGRYAFGGKQVHDANIVATMLAHGERRLLTFNVSDFRRFSDVIEVVQP